MSGTLSELARHVRETQDDALGARTPPPLEERLARIHAGLGRRGASVRGSLARSLGAGAAVGLAVSLLAIWLSAPPEPLTASVRGSALGAGSLIATSTEASAIGFSDGTSLELERDSRARLVRLDARGAELALERGTLRASVVPRPDARWVVAAGPFEVLVTGTRFHASWEPVREVLRVAMQEGSVRVSGSCLSEPRALSGHDEAEFSCTKQAAAVAPERPRAEAPAIAARSAPKSAPHKPANAAPASEPDWRELAREARFGRALEAAEKHGFSSLCASLPAADVLELGNVARLAGNPARAAEAYLAVRQRFAGSVPAASAAFQLGRIAFDGASDYASARRWFGAYLSEQPGGAFAQEALGRVMEAEHRSGDHDAARKSAERYLARHPGGAHAPLAQSLLAQ